MSKFGRAVQKWIDDKKMRQEDFGVLVGNLSQSAVDKVVRGETARPGNWKEWADVIGLDHETANAWINEWAAERGKITKLSKEASAAISAEAAKMSRGAVASPPTPTWQASRARVPVYGVAVGGDDGKSMFNGDLVEWTLCPPGLEDVPGVYATFVSGESMVPRFDPGQMVWAHPNRPTRRGDDVIVQIRNREGEAPFGFVKRFVRRTPKRLILAQFNPAKEIEFPIEDVVSMHKVVFAASAG